MVIDAAYCSMNGVLWSYWPARVPEGYIIVRAVSTMVGDFM